MSNTVVEKPASHMLLIDHGVEHGIQWVTCRAPLYGAANGYVKIPADHHWHGLDYDEIDVKVHGGLTYATDDGWIGFDTLHSGDVWPGCPRIESQVPWAKHWTDELVADETRALARAVAGADYRAAELSGSAAHLDGHE